MARGGPETDLVNLELISRLQKSSDHPRQALLGLN
jgi:hypothetical protein